MARLLVWFVVVLHCGFLASLSLNAEETVSPRGSLGAVGASPDEAPAPSLTSEDLIGHPEEDDSSEPMRLSMEFEDANLKDVLKLFSQQAKINVIAGKEIGDQRVTLYFEDVTAMDAFDQILRAGNLTYERLPESEIYVVTPRLKEGPAPVETITRVYRLKYARVSASVLAKAAAVFSSRTPFEATLTSAGGAAGGASGGGGGAAGGGGVEVGIDAVIKKLLTPQGEVVVDGRTNSLLITDIPENFPRLEGALAALDIRTPQIMVEAEIIETTLSKVKDLGLEWGTGSEGNLIAFTPGSAGRQTRFPFGWIGHGDAPSSPTAFPTSTLSFNSFQGVLQALENDADTKILARPKVLTLDNESAVIRLTSDEAIGFQTTTGEQTATTSSEPERTTTGVVLVVTPQVNEYGYITMIVEPSVTKTVASQITAPSGQAQPRDPKTRSSRTLVRIRSGDTLVVGGLIDRSEQESLRRVPILSGIPFLGEAFKNTEISNSASELIAFVTPRVLEEPGAAQVASAAQASMVSREQEPTTGTRQEAIEHTLNVLERQQPL